MTEVKFSPEMLAALILLAGFQTQATLHFTKDSSIFEMETVDPLLLALTGMSIVYSVIYVKY